ncbi:hypothetical protein JL09_g5778, partial [Pichia kudriavzevii]
KREAVRRARFVMSFACNMVLCENRSTLASN